MEPTNASLKTGLTNSEARVTGTSTSSASSPKPSERGSATGASGAGAGGMGGLADLMGGLGGGGMPDIATLMQNPMYMQMAQQLMANGGMERLMQNPSVANMVRRN